MVQNMAEDLMYGLGVVQTTEAIAEDTIKQAAEPLEEEEMPTWLGVI